MLIDEKYFTRGVLAFKKNEQLKKLRSIGDSLTDRVTGAVGTNAFLAINVIVFAAWLVMNTGMLGEKFIFDEYPFGMLTTAVSLEAIILSVFVLITQNRQAQHSEIRSELDFITNLQADAEVNVILSILERLSEKQNVDVSDLLAQLKTDHKKIEKEHPDPVVNEAQA